MSRDFYLVLGGGMVSLVTTLVVLFVTDWVNRRDQARERMLHNGSEVSPRAPESCESKRAEHVQ